MTRHLRKLSKTVCIMEKNVYLFIKMIRGGNNARSLDMTEHICHLIGHNFFQIQTLSGHFVNKKLKIISSFLGFKVIYHQSSNITK